MLVMFMGLRYFFFIMRGYFSARKARTTGMGHRFYGCEGSESIRETCGAQATEPVNGKSERERERERERDERKKGFIPVSRTRLSINRCRMHKNIIFLY